MRRCDERGCFPLPVSQEPSTATSWPSRAAGVSPTRIAIVAAVRATHVDLGLPTPRVARRLLAATRSLESPPRPAMRPARSGSLDLSACDVARLVRHRDEGVFVYLRPGRGFERSSTTSWLRYELWSAVQGRTAMEVRPIDAYRDRLVAVGDAAGVGVVARALKSLRAAGSSA